MKRNSCYAVDAQLLLLAAFTDRSLGIVEKCRLTLISSPYTGLVNKVVFHHRDRAWVEKESMRRRP